ncbi:MAG: NepR family anti-sigma factor [Paracoccaceae bacterium]
MKKPNIEDRQRPSARQAVIEDNLKRVYEATLAEDMPDRFKLLLDQLRDKERGQ